MRPPLPRIESDVPRTLYAQLEIVEAARTLMGADDEELRRRRRAVAAIFGELDAIKRDLAKAGEEYLASAKAALQRLKLAKRYNTDQPRVPAGNRDGGQWANEDDKNGSSTNTSDATSHRSRGPVRYAALDTNTLTDAGNVSYRGTERKAKIISASEIPADSPARPVPFLDSAGDAITIAGNQLLRPDNLPPSVYVNRGAASHLAEYIDSFNQAARGEVRDAEVVPGLLVGWAAEIALDLAPLKQGGNLDAERLQGQYVREYHDYANIAIGLYLAAANVKLDDGLQIANSYADMRSTFHEPMDATYTSLPKRDVRDITMGYELYRSGRIGLQR